MGNAQSLEGVQRSGKARQSTRSLPDQNRIKKDGSSKRKAVAPAQSLYHGSNSVGAYANGVYVGGEGAGEEGSKDFWAKDAAPYYFPSQVQTRKGPRSLDITFNKPWGGASNIYGQQRAMTESNYGSPDSPGKDAWSDVASDMYRIREKSKSRKYAKKEDKHYEHLRRKQKDYIERQLNFNDDFETQSEIVTDGHYGSGSGNLSMRSGRSHKSSGSSRRRHRDGDYLPASSTKAHGMRVSESDHVNLSSRSSKESKRYAKSGDVDKGSMQRRSGSRGEGRAEEKMMPPPPRPPKGSRSGGQSCGALDTSITSSSTNYPGEQWVDFPPPDKPNSLPGISDRSRVTFDDKHHKRTPTPQERYQLSPRRDGMTPPRSPGSAECDRLIIQSLRTELAEERTLRVEGEKKLVSLERENLEHQRLAETHSQKTRELEEEAERLRKRVEGVEEEKKKVVWEKEEEQRARDRLLDGIAGRVAKELEQLKNVKEECKKLQKQSMEYEWENKLLKAQLKLAGIGSPLSNGNPPKPTEPPKNNMVVVRNPRSTTGHKVARLKNYRTSMGSDPTLAPTECPDLPMNAIENINNNNLHGSDEGDATSPLMHGGEGLCSRPTSFALDPHVHDNSTPNIQSFTTRFAQTSLLTPLYFQSPRNAPSSHATPTARTPFHPSPSRLPPNLTPRIHHRKATVKPTLVTQPRTPLGTLNPLEKVRLLEEEDEEMYAGDELRNFAQQNSVPNSHPILDNSDASSVERARSAQDSISTSLHSDAFLRSLLISQDEKTFGRSTPKEDSADKKGKEEGKEEGGSLTPHNSALQPPNPNGSGSAESGSDVGCSSGSFTSKTKTLLVEQEKEVFTVGYMMQEIVSGRSEALFRRMEEKSSALTSAETTSTALAPCSFDDGYSTWSQQKQTRSASFPVEGHSRQERESLGSRLTGAGAMDTPADWDRLLQGLLVRSGGRDSEKSAETDTSSGVSSERDYLKAMLTVSGKPSFSCEDLATLPHPMWSSVESCSLSLEEEFEYGHQAGITVSHLATLVASGHDSALRRTKSETCLTSKTWGNAARRMKLLRLLLGCQKREAMLEEEVLGTDLLEGERSLSSCEFTEYERDILRLKKAEEAFIEQDIYFHEEDPMVPNGSPERMCDLDISDLPEEIVEEGEDEILIEGEGEERFFRNSFYVLCTHSFTSTPTPPQPHSPTPTPLHPPPPPPEDHSQHLRASPPTGEVTPTKERRNGRRRRQAEVDTSGSTDDTPRSRRGRFTIYDEMLASTSSSFTSEDSEDDGLATVQEWFKQLKTKKSGNVGKSVVRYTPTNGRPSILRRTVFSRFGESERNALAAFHFLEEHKTESNPEMATACSSSSSSSSGSSVCGARPDTQQKEDPERSEPVEVKLRRKKLDASATAKETLGILDKRKSRSWSNLQDKDYLVKFDDFPKKKLRGPKRKKAKELSKENTGVTKPKELPTSTDPKVMDYNNSCCSSPSDGSHTSSLFLSDLCAADKSFSSSSSLSFQCI